MSLTIEDKIMVVNILDNISDAIENVLFKLNKIKPIRPTEESVREFFKSDDLV